MRIAIATGEAERRPSTIGNFLLTVIDEFVRAVAAERCYDELRRMSRADRQSIGGDDIPRRVFNEFYS